MESKPLQSVVDFYTRHSLHSGGWSSHKYYIKADIDGTSCVPAKGDGIELVDPLSPDVSDAKLWTVATFLLIGRR